MVTSSISIGATLKFPEVALSSIRILVIAPTAPSKSRVDAIDFIVAAVLLGDMLDLVLLQCDEEQQHVLGMRHGLGFCKCQSSSSVGAHGCRADVTDLVEEVRNSNVIVTFNYADAQHVMWAGVEVAVVVLDGPDAPRSSTSSTLPSSSSPSASSSASSILRLLQLHRYARDRSYVLLVQSAAPSFSDEQIVESGIRAARNFGRGVAFCGVKCGLPMKPQLWTPISYEWDTSKWVKEVHDPYEKSIGWGSKSKV